MLRQSLEFPSQDRILRRNADGTGIEMALSHHDAAQRDKWCGRETDLLCPEQSRDHDVSAGFDTAIGLQNNPAAQIIHHQGLVSFRDTQLPG